MPKKQKPSGKFRKVDVVLLFPFKGTKSVHSIPFLFVPALEIDPGFYFLQLQLTLQELLQKIFSLSMLSGELL
jgi:hypothetical protein